MEFHCLYDCTPGLLPQLLFYGSVGALGFFAARWRRWTLILSLPVLLLGGGILFALGWPTWRERALQYGSLLLPLVGALTTRLFRHSRRASA